jgi:hypothetical protein
MYLSILLTCTYTYSCTFQGGRGEEGRLCLPRLDPCVCVCVCARARACVCMPELAYQLRSEHHSYNLIVVGKQPTTRTLGAYFYMHDHTYPHTQTHTQANSTVRATQNRSNKLHSAGSDKQGGLGHMNQHNSKSFTLRT